MRQVVFCLALLLALPAAAQQSEVRSVALANGCKPTKVEVIRQTFGRNPLITYQLACENKGPAPTTPPRALTIRCQRKLCIAN